MEFSPRGNPRPLKAAVAARGEELIRRPPGVGPSVQHEDEEQRAGEQLHHRVAERNARAAMAAAAAEQREAHQRNVVVPGDGLLAAGQCERGRTTERSRGQR